MRIAILADPLDNQNAGVHVFTREMVDAMIRTNPGHKIILLREKKDPNLKGVEQIAIGNIRLPLGFASLRLFTIIPWILHRKKVDVVIEPAHFGPFNLFKRIKRVTIIHDLTPVLFPKLHRWHSQILQKIFLKSILNKTDLIIANSDHTAKDICTVYPKNCNKVQRIYPGRNSQYQPLVNPWVLEKYKISKPYFLFVGTIEPRKNLTVLLEAFRLFKEEKNNPFKLVIVGGRGWKSESFYHALQNHPYKDEILCTGFVDTSELPTIYTQASALVYPSLYEGFGLPVLEALSCGSPVICSDNSSLPEVGGTVACYFDASDSRTLTDLLNKIATEPGLREQLAVPIQKHIEQFNWDHFAKQLWESILK